MAEVIYVDEWKGKRHVLLDNGKWYSETEDGERKFQRPGDRVEIKLAKLLKRVTNTDYPKYYETPEEIIADFRNDELERTYPILVKAIRILIHDDSIQG